MIEMSQSGKAREEWLSRNAGPSMKITKPLDRMRTLYFVLLRDSLPYGAIKLVFCGCQHISLTILASATPGNNDIM